MLKLTDVHAGYGGTEILRGVSFEVNAGEVITIVGANGAGKTTTLRSLCGVVEPTRGTISLKASALTGAVPTRLLQQV